MGFGRFVCVGLPFGLTLASLVCIMIAMLAGISNKSLDLFEVKTQNLSISSSDLQNLENLVKREDHFSALTIAALGNAAATASTSVNITAADLGLADSYKVSLWNYCAVTGSKTNCTSAKFNWAATALNTTTITNLASSTTGTTVTLPKSLTSALHTFTIFSKWTEVVYIIAAITCAIEIVLSLFAFCSRAGSCITFLISGLSTTTVIAASIMATVEASIVTGAIDSVAKAYGAKSSINTSFLATTWLAVVFSIASGFFWMFTICCCAADHHSKKSRRSRNGEDAEKLIPSGAYQRVEETGYHGGQQSGIYNAQQYATPAHNVKAERGGAYEPYSHAGI
ncbi:SUR7 protein-like protein [Mollisia scopiformis]|uniref:SUR7 protein-like protein n=1 Tax=Mollisia scopiformis TaxID=149040 RepID=A0A194XFF3_MOLSC|nr:SUR7 protein-like protein [Mollisia scopiformis]KUJ18864.1 SUR7 protein-like protein [Mollisia scopiformis]